MANFFCYDANGQKRGPFNEQQLAALAARGGINPNTPLESDTGHKGLAGQIPGLQFKTAAPSVHQPTPPSAATPAVEKSAGSSWQVTLIGAVLIMVVGGIGWAIIEKVTPSPEQTPSEKGGEAVAAVPAEAATQRTASSQFQFTAAEQAEIDRFCRVNGSDVKATVGQNGKTLLHLAVSENEDIAVLKFLVSNGADVHAKTNNGHTPLHEAAFTGNVEVAQFLISNGADVNVKRKLDGLTPLHFVTVDANVGMAQFLVSEGADVHARAQYGITPFYSAVSNGNFEIAQFFLSKGADVNTTNTDGNTPLHSAASRGNGEVVQFLISNGADTESNADTQYLLGLCYYHGKGVAKNSEEAMTWFRKAAEQGQDGAQFMLGESVKNPVEAVAWYRKAAEQGNGAAMFKLGGCYKNGTGVRQNLTAAKIWYQRAAKTGINDANLLVSGIDMLRGTAALKSEAYRAATVRFGGPPDNLWVKDYLRKEEERYLQWEKQQQQGRNSPQN